MAHINKIVHILIYCYILMIVGIFTIGRVMPSNMPANIENTKVRQAQEGKQKKKLTA